MVRLLVTAILATCAFATQSLADEGVSKVHHCYFEKYTPVLGLKLIRNADGQMIGSESIGVVNGKKVPGSNDQCLERAEQLNLGEALQTTSRTYYCYYSRYSAMLGVKIFRNRDGRIISDQVVGEVEGYKVPGSNDNCLGTAERLNYGVPAAPGITRVYHCYYEKWTPILGLKLIRNSDSQVLVQQFIGSVDGSRVPGDNDNCLRMASKLNSSPSSAESKLDTAAATATVAGSTTAVSQQRAAPATTSICSLKINPRTGTYPGNAEVHLDGVPHWVIPPAANWNTKARYEAVLAEARQACFTLQARGACTCVGGQ